MRVKVGRWSASLGWATWMLVLCGACPLSAKTVAGPGSSQPPQVLPFQEHTKVVSLLTAGDSVAGARFAGALAGVAALERPGSVFSVFVSHDLAADQGVVRRHGAGGSFVSEWVYNQATLAPVAGGDLLGQMLRRDGSTWVELPALSLNHLGGLDLPPASAFLDPDSGQGTAQRFLLVGESEGNGHAVAVQVSGTAQGNAYLLPWADATVDPAQQVAGRQLRAHPGAGGRTLVMAHLAGAQQGLLLYVGDKRVGGGDVDRAGLVGGQVYRLAVPGFTQETRADDAGLGLVDGSTRFGLIGGSGDALKDRVNPLATRWLDPHDGIWDPQNPRRYYFVTTDRIDASKDGGSDTPTDQRGRSRLWRLTFADLSKPEAGGTLDMLENGKAAQGAYQRLAALAIGRDGSLDLAEDPGLHSRTATLWRSLYRSGADRFKPLAARAAADAALFGPLGPRQRSEGFGNLVDLDPVLDLPGGRRRCLLTVLRDRTPDFDPEIVEGGQQLLMCLR